MERLMMPTPQLSNRNQSCACRAARSWPRRWPPLKAAAAVSHNSRLAPRLDPGVCCGDCKPPAGGLMAPNSVITAKLLLARAVKPLSPGSRVRRLRAWIHKGTMPSNGTPQARAHSQRVLGLSASRRRQALFWVSSLLPINRCSAGGRPAVGLALPAPGATPHGGGPGPPANGKSNPPLRRRWRQGYRLCRPLRIRRFPHRFF